MTWKGALLVLIGLAGGAAAAPAAARDLPGDYQCCSDKRLEKTFFDAPKKVTDAASCQKYCKEKGYGSPVFSKSWGCAPAKFACRRSVANRFCESRIGSLGGYFKLYPESYFTSQKEVSTRTTSGTDNSATDTKSTDTTVRDRTLIGGTGRDIRKENGLTQVDITVKRKGVIDTTKLIGETKNFGGGRSTTIGDGFQINVGRTGRADLTQSIAQTGRNTTGTIRTNLVVDTSTSESQNRVGPGGSQSALTRNVVGSETTRGRDDTRRSVTQNLNSTSASVRGDATLNSNLLLGDRAKDLGTLGELTTNVNTTVIRGRGTISTSGTGIRDIGRQSNEDRARLDTDGVGATLRTETIGLVGSTVIKSVTSGRADIDTDGVKVTKAGVGSIGQVKNNTVGREDNTTSIVDVENRVTTIQQDTECPNCAGTGKEVTRSKDVKDTVVIAGSKFNDKTVSTSTAAGGKRLDLKGQTRTETNGTVLDTQSQQTKISDRSGKVEKGCDKKAGGCELVTESSGSTTTVSRNSSNVNDEVNSSKQVVSVSTYVG